MRYTLLENVYMVRHREAQTQGYIADLYKVLVLCNRVCIPMEQQVSISPAPVPGDQLSAFCLDGRTGVMQYLSL